MAMKHHMTIYYASWYADEEEHTQEDPCRYSCSCGADERTERFYRSRILDHLLRHIDSGDEVSVEGNWSAENDI